MATVPPLSGKHDFPISCFGFVCVAYEAIFDKCKLITLTDTLQADLKHKNKIVDKTLSTQKLKIGVSENARGAYDGER